MEQFEQLLTCCVCLDRYRNPKLLPCQHSFCMEPCMDGLVDYVRRQVKCPECRAEHRIPYNGVQGFPTNVTLQRFLELHIEITGELPDPTSGQVMERCAVCSEKAYCSCCVHCDKKICPDCKGAHMDILRREIVRINNQVRRSVHRLQDILALVEKNMQNLSINCNSVTEEIDEMNKRLEKAVRDRTHYLRGEVDRYLTSEMKNLRTLKENLELEIANIQSNCDLADNHMNESVEWDDCELVDTKEIFLKTVEFMRNFEYETSDYNRRVRFTMALDPNQLVMNVANYGDLNIIHPAPANQMLQVPGGPGLLRSKSDHRLAAQFRQQEAALADDEPLLGGRKFGERPPQKKPKEDHSSRSEYDYDYDQDSSSRPKSRFRSRFVRGHQQDNDSDNEARPALSDKEKNKITSTEDTSKGPLSGIFRIMDSPRVMKRLQDQERGTSEKKPTPPPQTQNTTTVAPVAVVPKNPPVTQVKKTTARQLSEDEIDRIKRQNKGSTSTAASAAAAATTTTTEPERPSTDRVSALKPPTPSSTPPRTLNNADDNETRRTPPIQQQHVAAAASKPTPLPATPKPIATARSTSSDSATSESSAGTTANTVNAASVQVEKKPFQSRFLQTQPAAPAQQQPTKPQEEESEESSEEEEEETSEESEEEEDEEPTPTPAPKPTPTHTPVTRPEPVAVTSTRAPERKDSREETSTRPAYSWRTQQPSGSFERDESPKYGRVRSSATSAAVADPPEDRYSSYSSRFLNKSKSTAVVTPEDEKDEDSDSRYGTGRSRYMALKERRNQLTRSRSSHHFGNDDDDDEPVSPTTVSPSAYLASRYGASSSHGTQNELSRSRSTHALKSREPSPERGAASSSTSTTNKDGGELSSWARYLKNKYGSRSRENKDTPTNTSSTTSTSSSSAVTPSNTARRLSLGLPLRQANDYSSDDDHSKNVQGSPTSPTAAQALAGIVGPAGTSPRAHYLQKRRQLFQIGGRGSEPGSFTWPRGIAVGPDNTIVVADSSNHRVQVFDENGIFQKEFGQYGNGDGEFDCLAGIAVNKIGQYIIADRYNHRIQILDPNGKFVRSFGSQGTSDGKFNYPWGIGTDSLGFIYVCDKENHRVQVFQSDGTFVGKFGTCGNREGQLEHPHYIGVSSNNRVVVSDSNNHRIQIFDINGRVLASFGGEGSEEGQFKFPRGVAVDDHGYIIVADSGNNRIQIFHPDGNFLRSFGSWGSGDAEFKGLEGVSVMKNGSILVCDRENHRVQVF